MTVRGRKSTLKEEVAQEPAVQESEVKQEVKRPVKRQIERNELVEVRNITNGTLVYVSKRTGLEMVLHGFGASDFIEVGELITMKSSAPKLLAEPYLVIENLEVVEFLGLKHVYDKMVPLDKLEQFFNLPIDEMEDILKKVPNGIKVLIASKAKELYDSGELDSKKKISLIESRLNLELEI